ncbi:MAG: 1-acyl-sn-glycerol-3-phosphate acyltransferase, partial [Candidatus Dadabacteria bacterium]
MKGPALAGLFFFVEAALKTFISSAILPYLGQVLFSILKLYAKLAIKIYCRKIIINKPSTLRLKGPLLIAANHPNSFLDGIIFSTLFEHETYLLARGDAFRKKHHSWILRKLYMLPVYRTSEGPENLNHNYATFAACQDAFEQGAIVVIFSEGSCFNEWHLRPLRKGTARLAISSWQKSIDLPVIPAGINYNTFRSFGKNVFLNFGTALNCEEILLHETDGKLFSSFNEQLNEQLQQLVYEINPEDKKEQKRRFYIQLPTWKKMILSLPAL